jgi:hypothetical protein
MINDRVTSPIRQHPDHHEYKAPKAPHKKSVYDGTDGWR